MDFLLHKLKVITIPLIIHKALILILLPHFTSVALIASISSIVAYAASAIALPILRREKPEVIRPFRLPMHRLVTLLAFIMATWLIYWASWPWTFTGSILFLLAFPLYFLMKGTMEGFSKINWLLIYLLGLSFISYIDHRIYQIPSLILAIVVTLFPIVIYFYAIRRIKQ